MATFDKEITPEANVVVVKLPLVTLRREHSKVFKGCLSEVNEIINAVNETKSLDDFLNSEISNDDLQKEAVLEELVDLLYYLTSVLSYYETDRVQQIVEAVYEKNKARGYYTPGGEDYKRDETRGY